MANSIKNSFSFTIEEKMLNDRLTLSGETMLRRTMELLVKLLSDQSNNVIYKLFNKGFTSFKFSKIEESKGEHIPHKGEFKFPAGGKVNEKAKVSGTLKNVEGQEKQVLHSTIKASNALIAEFDLSVGGQFELPKVTGVLVESQMLSNPTKPRFDQMPYLLWELTKISLDQARSISYRQDRELNFQHFNDWKYVVLAGNWIYNPPHKDSGWIHYEIYLLKTGFSSRHFQIRFFSTWEEQNTEKTFSTRRREEFAVYNIVTVRRDYLGENSIDSNGKLKNAA